MRISRSKLAIALLYSLVAITASPVRAAILERGPYLQQVTPNSITVRWRTDSQTDAVVRYGAAPDALVFTAVSGQTGTEHEVTVLGLAPGTLYYYSIGDSTGTLAGGDTSFRFLTSPSAGASSTTRIWVIGDSGTANSSARAVRDAYIAYAGNEPADIWLMLGDNAYSDGTDSEYQSAVFDMYPTILRTTPLWPTLGNHDGHSADSNSEQGPYYDIFTLPRNAEAGGLASGTEAYYSFDYGNIHFVTLDSYETDRSTNGAMLTWLESDLAATNKEWLIAFWHHPPYSKGSHNSDSSSEGQMRDMREHALPILESYGVDLVLTGHSHSYERSTFIDGHYGLSNTFDPASMEIDGGSGREGETGAYNKPDGGNAHQGTVYAVAGSSGKTSPGPLDHPIMFISLQTLGSMMLDVNSGRLDAMFIDSSGERRDYFTIEKGSPPVDSDPPTTPGNLAASNIAQTSLTLSWQASTDNVGVTGYRIARDGNVLTTTMALTFDDSGLTAGTQYSYTVVALDAAGNVSAPASVTASAAAAPDVDPPTTPGNLAASNIAQTSLTLSWQASTDNVGVTGYRIARDGNVLTTTMALTFDDSGLTAGTQYSYTVVALDAAGNVSAPASVTASAAAAPDVDPPTTPGNLAASNIAQTSLTLSWQASTDNVGVTGYRIARDGNVLTTTMALTFDDSGLTAGTQYSYTVVALDAAGNVSAPASVTASAAAAPDVDPPTMPANLTVNEFTATSVSLAWEASSDNVGVTEYRVSRDGAMIASIDSLSFVDGNLTPGTSYAYSVVALDAAGNDSPEATVMGSTSTLADVDPPTTPANLSASAVTSNSVTVTWDAASDNVGVTEYQVSRDGAVISSSNVLTLIDSNLTPATTYAYSVVALDAAGNVSVPATISATTAAASDVDAPSSVVNLTASSITTTSATLTWDAAGDNVGVTEYHVSRDGAVISNSNALTLIDNSLSPATTYAYSVIALDAAGNVSVPATVSVTTQTVGSGANTRSGGGVAGLLELLALALLLAISRWPRLGNAIPVGCLTMLLCVPQPVVAHADLDEQLAIVNTRLTRQPDDHNLLAKRGNLHAQHGDWQLALADLTGAQALAPDDAAMALNVDIGAALLRGGQAKQALSHVDRYIVAHRNSSRAWRLRAQIQLQLDNTDAALEDINRSIQYTTVPTPEHYFERARILEKDANRFDELLAGIDDGIERLGPIASLLQYAIDIEIQRNNHVGALTRIAALPGLIREQPRWIYRRSQLLEELGEYAEAQSVNRMALQAIERIPARRRGAAAFEALRHDIEHSYAALLRRETSAADEAG